MNCESCDDPKNSFTTAETGFALMRSCGIRFVMSEMDIRSFTARSIRVRPTRNWFSSSSPTDRTRRLPRWSISSVDLEPSLTMRRWRITATISSLRSVLTESGASICSFLLIMNRPTPHEGLGADCDLLDVRLDELLEQLRGERLARRDQGLAMARRLHVLRDPRADVRLGVELHPGVALLEPEDLLAVVEVAQNLLVREDHALLEEPERAQERGGEHLPPPV